MMGLAELSLFVNLELFQKLSVLKRACKFSLQVVQRWGHKYCAPWLKPKEDTSPYLFCHFLDWKCVQGFTKGWKAARNISQSLLHFLIQALLWNLQPKLCDGKIIQSIGKQCCNGKDITANIIFLNFQMFYF